MTDCLKCGDASLCLGLHREGCALAVAYRDEGRSAAADAILAPLVEHTYRMARTPYGRSPVEDALASLKTSRTSFVGGRNAAEDYAADSKSIGAANRSTGNHSLACARVLRDEEYAKQAPPRCGRCGRSSADSGPGEAWHAVGTGLAHEAWRCPLCYAAEHGDGTAARVRDDDPPADWLALAVWCGLSVLAACVSIGALMAARALGWLS